jgi:predicted AlkP superfamily pyrophosphatase or phosphodiesterase
MNRTSPLEYVLIGLRCLAIAVVLPPLALASTNHHVILITIDGCAAYYLNDTKAPLQTLRKLAREGATAEGMRVSNPAITWPNHTTLVTGVHPEKHSVLFNGVLVRPGPGKPVRVDGQRDKSELVAVPTLYDQLHRAGYRTADINWPCTRRAATLDDSFPDVPDQISHLTPRLRDELIVAGILEGTNDASFRLQSAAVKDQIWTAAAAHVIEKRRPNFMLLHMLVCDSTQHKHGPRSPAAYTALGLADAQLAEVLRSLDRAGIRDRTTLIVTADHGFETALKIINPNVAFRKAGLLEAASAPGILQARAQIVSEGGIAMVYFTDPATASEDEAKVRALMREHQGIADILSPPQFSALRMPDPAVNRQMAQLILVAGPGYAFNNEAQGDSSLTEVTLEIGNQGHHGYLSGNPKMNALFIAWGRGIKRGAKIGVIDNLDVAPTAARLLGQTLPGADGRVLAEILDRP